MSTLLSPQAKLSSAGAAASAELAQRRGDEAAQSTTLQQTAVQSAFIQSVLRSRRWRIGEALAQIGRLFRAPAFTTENLTPWQHLEADGGLGRWRATGSAPRFLALGYLPSGWLRIRLTLTSEVVGRLALHVLSPDGTPRSDCLEACEILGVLERELYVHLDRPALGICFDPLDRPGPFQLERFEVKHLPGPAAAWRAVRHKLRLLVLHKVVGRTLGNGLKLLLLGRWREFGRKVLKGLPSQGPLADGAINELRLTAEVDVPRRPASARRLVVVGRLMGLSGYDNVVYEVTRGLHSVGANLRLDAGNRMDRAVVPRYFRRLIAPCRAGDAALVIAPPPHLERYGVGANSVVLTMWESDTLAPDCVEQLNRARLVVVPSVWGVACFRRSGVVAPIVQVPLGHDPLLFHDSDDFPAQLTFGVAAALRGGGVRKNVHRLLDLFRQAFPSEDVRLKVKLTPDCPPLTVEDRRVELTRAALPPLALASWYRSLTAFVSVSHGEGFGLHLVEAMACGRPVVTSPFSAVGEYFDESVGYPVAYDLVEAAGDCYVGQWAAPRAEELIEQLRAIYRDPMTARDRGRRAAARARRYTWKATIARLARVLREHGIL